MCWHSDKLTACTVFLMMLIHRHIVLIIHIFVWMMNGFPTDLITKSKWYSTHFYFVFDILKNSRITRKIYIYIYIHNARYYLDLVNWWWQLTQYIFSKPTIHFLHKLYHLLIFFFWRCLPNRILSHSIQRLCHVRRLRALRSFLDRKPIFKNNDNIVVYVMLIHINILAKGTNCTQAPIVPRPKILLVSCYM